MVGRERAARLEELGHRQAGGPVHGVLVHSLPYFVEIDEPIEELGVLDRGQGAGEGLVEVVVGVDEAREDDVSGRVQDLGAGGGGSPASDARYAIAFDQDVDAAGRGPVGAKDREAILEQYHFRISRLKSSIIASRATTWSWSPPQ